MRSDGATERRDAKRRHITKKVLQTTRQLLHSLHTSSSSDCGPAHSHQHLRHRYHHRYAVLRSSGVVSTSTLGPVGCDCKHDKCHLKTLFLFPKPHALDPEPQAVNPRGSLRKRLDDGFGSWQRQHLSSPQDFGIWENQGFGFQAFDCGHTVCLGGPHEGLATTPCISRIRIWACGLKHGSWVQMAGHRLRPEVLPRSAQDGAFEKPTVASVV